MSDQIAELHDSVAQALREHDKARAVRLAITAVDGGAVHVATLYGAVLAPLLAETGAAWQRGDRHVWEEHLASAAVRTIVEALYPRVLEARAAVAPAGRSILLACPPEEAHDLGLRMLADRFELAGWTTYFIGADTPPDEIVDAARSLGVDAVGLSSSTHYHRLALRHFVDELKQRLPGVAVWVGGPAFARDREGWSDDELLDVDRLLGAAQGPSDRDGTAPGEGIDGTAPGEGGASVSGSERRE